MILSGQLLAVFMSNAGGAWDNAKKSIEDEPVNLKANTGKGSERHKAGVVGDTSAIRSRIPPDRRSTR